MKPKICHCISRFEKGGQTNVLKEIVTRLTDDFDVSVICKGIDPDALIPKDIDITVVPGNAITSPIKAIRKLDEYDIVHTQGSTFMYASVKSSAKSVNSDHGNSPVRFRETLRSKIEAVAYEHFRKWGNKNVEAMISISKYLQKEIMVKHGINSICIPNGCDQNRFRPLQEGVEDFHLGDPMLLYVGYLCGHKGVIELIRSLPDIREEYPSVMLALIGYGPCSNFLKEEVHKRNLTENVTFLGYVSDEELPIYYNACDVFVTPSYWEGFGLPILEAMACGKPVVARNVTAQKDHILDSNAGELFNSNKEMAGAIIEVLDMGPERYKSNALKYASEFTWDRCVEQIKEVYYALLEK